MAQLISPSSLPSTSFASPSSIPHSLPHGSTTVTRQRSYRPLADMINVHPDSNGLCVGWAPSKRRRCTKTVSRENRRLASRLLQEGDRRLAQGRGLGEIFHELAPLVLCKIPTHQDQASSKAASWQREICSCLLVELSDRLSGRNPTVRSPPSAGSATERNGSLWGPAIVANTPSTRPVPSHQYTWGETALPQQHLLLGSNPPSSTRTSIPTRAPILSEDGPIQGHEISPLTGPLSNNQYIRRETILPEQRSLQGSNRSSSTRTSTLTRAPIPSSHIFARSAAPSVVTVPENGPFSSLGRSSPPPSEPDDSVPGTRTVRRPITINQECTICTELLVPDGDPLNLEFDTLTWCAGECGTNFHRHCIEFWRQAISTAFGFGDADAETPHTCPHCRALWRDDPDLSELEVLPSEAEDVTTDDDSNHSNEGDERDYSLHEQIASSSPEAIEDEPEQYEGQRETDSLEADFESDATPSEVAADAEGHDEARSDTESSDGGEEQGVDDGQSTSEQAQIEKTEVEESEADKSGQVCPPSDTVSPHIRSGAGLPAFGFGEYLDAISLLIRCMLQL